MQTVTHFKYVYIQALCLHTKLFTYTDDTRNLQVNSDRWQFPRVNVLLSLDGECVRLCVCGSAYWHENENVAPLGYGSPLVHQQNLVNEKCLICLMGRWGLEMRGLPCGNLL